MQPKQMVISISVFTKITAKVSAKCLSNKKIVNCHYMKAYTKYHLSAFI